jgi:hypothetical protein
MINILGRDNTAEGANERDALIIATALICWGGFSQAFAAPIITTQPTNQSVSLGAKVIHLVSATTVAPPLSYQWRFNGTEIAGTTQRTLTLTNLQAVDAGGYSVLVADGSGAVTSRVAQLEVDSTFRMVTTGPIVTDTGLSVGVAWGDYDNDGFVDLLVGNINSVDFLYRNRGDGSFERVLTNVIGGLGFGGGAWGDYDNDGFLDLYTITARDLGVCLFHNEGNGTLLRLTNTAVVGPIISDHTFSGSTAWGDYDNDGFLDVFVANGTFQGDLKNFLYHNEGNGRFTKVTAGSLFDTSQTSWSGVWVDYDDDGRLDLFVTNDLLNDNPQGEDNQLFHNDGPAGFTLMTSAQTKIPLHDGGHSRGCAWGDYDNDGRIDLFVAGHTNLLYHNNGDGSFQKIITGQIVTDPTTTESIGCTWVDYDNDGYLDLFVVNVSDNNFLYHNNGNGTFTRVNSGSLVNDVPTLSHIDAAWADYDNDGFMDVVIVADGGKNSLFHNNGINNGNTNHWINLRLVGTASNRQALGAKVRLKATIGGKSFWQRRDIGAFTSQEGQSDLRASFGLGDATNVDTVRIEWPSGTVQELHNLGTKQFLTVTEPARLKGGIIGGQYQLVLNGGVGFTYGVQASTNLVDWTSFTNLVATNMTMPVMSLEVGQAPERYFRAVRR